MNPSHVAWLVIVPCLYRLLAIVVVALLVGLGIDRIGVAMGSR